MGEAKGQLEQATARPRVWVVVLVAVLGLYGPTSVGGTISSGVLMATTIVVCASWALLVLLVGGQLPMPDTLLGVAIMLLPLLFTVTTPLREVSYGAIVVYLSMAMLWPVHVRDLAADRLALTAFTLCGVVNVGLGLGLVLDVKAVDAFVYRWYSAFYPTLLEQMIGWHDKPVLTFATHSLAAFFYYLFFFGFFVGFLWTRRPLLLALAVAHLALCATLRSTSATIFVGVGVLQLFGATARAAPRAAVTVLAAVLGGTGVVLLLRPDFAMDYARTLALAVFGHEQAGLLARYARGGVLAGNLSYLLESPLSPVGFGYSDRLFFGDSGVIVYVLRGTLLLPVTIYLAFWLFLRRNLHQRWAAWWLWTCTVAFEVGFTPLLYHRFLALLPLLIVYLNALAREKCDDIG